MSHGKEAYRKAGDTLNSQLKQLEIDKIQVCDKTKEGLGLYFAEGIVLGNYVFDKYKTKKEPSKLKEVALQNEHVSKNRFLTALFSNPVNRRIAILF